MRIFGLVGKKLGHSHSKQWFEQFFREHSIQAQYLNFEIDSIEQIGELLNKNPSLTGFNITIPFKKEVKKICHSLSREAEETGSVNCISVIKGKLTGYNTDIDGFSHLLDNTPYTSESGGAMILGTGGAAASAAYVLKKRGVPNIFVSRSHRKENAIFYSDINDHHLKKYPLIINATPAGMWPDIDSAPPFPYGLLTGKEILTDMVYNPEETKFMRSGAAQGCFTVNGLQMLFIQAKRSWDIWNGKY